MSPLVVIGGGMFTFGLLTLWRGAETRRRRLALAILALAGAVLVLVTSLASHRERSHVVEAAERERRAVCLGTARALEELERLPQRFDDDLASCRDRASACALAELGSGLQQIVRATTVLCVDLRVEPPCDAVDLDLGREPDKFRRALGELARMHASGRCER